MAALTVPDGLAFEESSPGQAPRIAGSTSSTGGFRIRAEKILSPSYASALVLDYGTLSLADIVGNARYRLYDFTLVWEQRANSSGAWVPAEGWTWGWGPQGKSLRPSMDVKIAGHFDLAQTDHSFDQAATSQVALMTSLPLFNGCSLLAGLSSPLALRRNDFLQGSRRFSDLVWAQTAFDSKGILPTFSAGLELAWPQFGYPNPDINANPDGRVLRPCFSFLGSSYPDEIYGTGGYSLQGTLKLPLSPSSSVSVGIEKFQGFRRSTPQRYTLAWQIYASNPEHQTPKAVVKTRPEAPAGPYHRPTERP